MKHKKCFAKNVPTQLSFKWGVAQSVVGGRLEVNPNDSGEGHKSLEIFSVLIVNSQKCQNANSQSMHTSGS